jgi:O-antigen ligase
MAKTQEPADRLKASVPVALIALSFVSSGAWFVVQLPPIPMAKAFQLGTAGIWLVAFGLGLAAWERPDRRVLWGLGAMGAAVAVSYLINGSLAAVAFYDLFAQMPLLQWLAFIVVFMLAAGMRMDRARLGLSLGIVVGLGAALSVVMSYQQLTMGGSGVFGSTAYSITALAPLIPIGVGLAAADRGARRAGWLAAAAVVAASLAVFSGSTMGALATVFALAASIAVWPAFSSKTGLWSRLMRIAGVVVGGLMIAAILFAQIPALSGVWINPTSLRSLDRNTVARVYLWQGAEGMVAKRPFFGFGPSGYRLHAAEFLGPEALQYGPDKKGNADPTVYSPQSPHSVFWEIATRLGLLGLLAFGMMAATWVMVVVGRARTPGDDGALRVALAAGFATAVFVLLVNPVHFAIGLFAAVAAGLAVAPVAAGKAPTGKPGKPDETTGRVFRIVSLTAGIAVLVAAAWLYVGESRVYGSGSGDPERTIADSRAALGIVAGHPLAMRLLLENELLVATDVPRALAAQRAVDAAPGYMREYAPNLVNFAAYSLAQAERTGRRDLSWEARQLATAAALLPEIPSLAAERLHLAVLSGDRAAVQTALPAAERWGGPYPYTADYVKRAKAMLGGK